MRQRYLAVGLALAISGVFASQPTPQAQSQSLVPPDFVAAQAQVGCGNAPAKRVTIVSDSDLKTTTLRIPNFQTVLTTTFTIPGTAQTCVVATFSTMQLGADFHANAALTAYQIDINGVPMVGHFPSCYGLAPCFGHSGDGDLDQIQMQAWQRLNPGTYTIRVRFASDPSSTSAESQVAGSVLTITEK